MRINFNKENSSLRFRDKARKAIRFYLKKLGVPHIKLKNLDLDIEIKDYHGERGSIIHDDGASYKYPNANKHIKMAISAKDPSKNKLISIAHECVHIKQLLMGEMVTHEKSTLWRGKEYELDQSLDDYYDSPWEIEAYGKEYGLYARFAKHLKQTK